MPFPAKIVENLLVKSGRRCCLCREYKGTKIQVHHINPESVSRDNSEDNGIPLCLDCHADVQSYNDKHPIGKKFQPSELKRHRDEVFKLIATGSTLHTKIISNSEASPVLSAQSPADDLSFIIITNPLDERVRWGSSYNVVDDNPICIDCLVPMRDASASLDNNYKSYGGFKCFLWLCPRCDNHFVWDNMQQHNFILDYVADEFNARLLRLGKRATMQPHYTI